MRRTTAGPVTLLRLRLGDEDYEVSFSRLPGKVHTMPDEPAEAPSLDECAEVASRIFICAAV